MEGLKVLNIFDSCYTPDDSSSNLSGFALHDQHKVPIRLRDDDVGILDKPPLHLVPEIAESPGLRRWWWTKRKKFYFFMITVLVVLSMTSNTTNVKSDASSYTLIGDEFISERMTYD